MMTASPSDVAVLMTYRQTSHHCEQSEQHHYTDRCNITSVQSKLHLNYLHNIAAHQIHRHLYPLLLYAILKIKAVNIYEKTSINIRSFVCSSPFR